MISEGDGYAASGAGRVPRAVLVWLFCLAALVGAMIIVGGATRLTDSGLSITEWKPITGAVPPLTRADWEDAFQKYQQIPQYEQLNKGMSLEEFQFIFWWEWGHRFLGRFVGVVFFVPFLVFWLTRRIPASLMSRLVGIFVLGGLQGALGWYMVASGLVERVSVSQYRLAAHLGLAFVIMGFILWVAYRASGVSAPPGAGAQAGRRTAVALVLLLFVQMLLGALVAGLDAGMAYNSWPLMDGRVVPDGLFVMQPWLANVFENVKTVQFDHRVLAYAIWVIALVHATRLGRAGSPRAQGAILLAVLVTAQAGLGIWTLLEVVPLWLGLAHQFGAIVVFAVAVHHMAALVPAAQPARAQPQV